MKGSILQINVCSGTSVLNKPHRLEGFEKLVTVTRNTLKKIGACIYAIEEMMFRQLLKDISGKIKYD